MEAWAEAELSESESSSTLLRVRDLRKEYQTGPGSGKQSLMLFDKLSFSVRKGELLAIMGASGAGKSTLLHLLGALDRPSGGDVYFAANPLTKLSPTQAAELRNREIGYVWQFHYLLPEFTAAENVAMPLLARGESKKYALAQAESWLEEVGLSNRTRHKAGELSGGEQQRVSLARALITEPKLLLADEPTGDLDATTAASVFDLILRLHRTRGLTSVVVTHNIDLAARCDRVLRLEGGRVKLEQPQAEPDRLVAGGVRTSSIV